MIRVSIIQECTSGEADQILQGQFNTLTEKFGHGLITMIPDIPFNQSAIDIFNKRIKRLCVCNLVVGIGERMTEGVLNKRSAYIDLSSIETNEYGYPLSESVGRGKGVEYYPYLRTTTVEGYPDLHDYVVENSDVCLFFWKTDQLQKITRYANSLNKTVFVFDV